MKNKTNYLEIISIPIVILSSIIIYFNTYKYYPNLLLINKLIFIVSFFILFDIFIGKIKYLKKENYVARFFNFIISIISAFVIIFSLLSLEKLSTVRKNNILKTKLICKNIATVIEINKIYHYRSTIGYFQAVIEYKVDNKNIVQAIENNENIYTNGQKITIEYSIEYPEMFIVK